MPKFSPALLLLGTTVLATAIVAACGGMDAAFGTGGTKETAPAPLRTIWIAPGADAYRQAQEALIAARPGDAICFRAGEYDFTRTLTVQEVNDITICGEGMETTVLKFSGSAADEGISANHTDGIVIRDLTVLDTPGDGIKVGESDGVTFQRVTVKWSCGPCGENGSYAFYPVLSKNVLIEDSVASGASDAGVYVGQSDNVIVRGTRAEFNVAGFEIENTTNAEIHDSEAVNNTGGFLIFSHPNLAKNDGFRTRIYNNKVHDNNTTNFAPGGDVQYIPRGTGLIAFSYDEIEAFNNEFRNHDTSGVLIVSGRLVETLIPEGFDPYVEKVHFHDNIFNGGGDDGLSEGRLPQGSDNLTNPPDPTDPRDQGKLLVDALITLIRAKYIANPNPATLAGGRLWPYINWDGDSNPALAADGRLTPDRGLCFRNNFDDAGVPIDMGIFYPGIDQAANVNPQQRLAERDGGTLNSLATVPADPLTRPEHDCSLPPLPAIVIPPRPPVTNTVVELSAEETARHCGAMSNGVNFAAYKADCPLLANFNLFADPHDPRSAANSGGFPYDLTTPLFSDYATKYRVLYLPPGLKARYVDESTGAGDDNAKRSATFDLPVGTIIAKTFAFRADLANPASAEHVVETRLLIHRESGWVGLPYIWDEDMQAARLAKSGGARAVSFRHPTRGQIDASYEVPNANQCVTCHGRDDNGDGRKDGSVPIGPKARLLNRENVYGGVPKNQLVAMRELGLLEGWHGDPASTPRLPVWDNPADGTAEQRTRAYLESNCMHCHRPNGHANLSGLYLDSFRAVDTSFGICKRPTAAGQGSGGFEYDIVPRDPDASILVYRMNSVEPSARMPELAKSVAHSEGVEIVRQWIEAMPMEQYPDCESSQLPLPP